MDASHKPRTYYFSIGLTCLLLVLLSLLSTIDKRILWIALSGYGSILVVNTLFIFAPAIFISYVAARAFLLNRSLSVLFFGCAFLMIGFASLLAGELLVWTNSANGLVTVHNLGVLLSSLLFFSSSLFYSHPNRYLGKNPRFMLALFYVGTIIVIHMIGISANYRIFPAFFEQGKGPTLLRQLILGVGIAFYIHAGILLVKKYLQHKSSFVLWYSLALLLISVGFCIILIQERVGGMINILGRNAQYGGYLCAMIAVIAALREAQGVSRQLEDSQYAFFLNMEENGKILLETAIFAIVATDSHDRIFIWNSGAERLFGVEKRQVVGHPLREIFYCSEKNLKRHELYDDRIYTEYEAAVETSKGQRVSVEVAVSAKNLPGGAFRIYVFKDITERKRYETELTKISKLDLVGQMAASIAHEMRNPMTTVRGFLQYYSENDRVDEKVKAHFSLMIDEIDRANSIITEYLSLAKNKTSTLKLRNLSSVIKNMKELLETYVLEQGRNISFEIDLSTSCSILMDQQEIKQLVSNLVRNAVEALPPQGIIKIAVAQRETEVILSVVDNGPGISTNLINKLGTPFITTKSDRTGLGLSVCYRIASRHHAVIQVDCNHGGTAIHIHFPMAKS